MPNRRIHDKLLERTDVALFQPTAKPTPTRRRVDPRLTKVMAAPRPAALSADAIRTALAGLAPRIADRLKQALASWQPGAATVLSAKTPVIPGWGNIDGWNVLAYNPTTPALYFDYGADHAAGGLEIWLESLEPAGVYLVEISLSVLGGSIRVGASDAPHVISPAQGLDHKILVTIVDPTYDRSLITLSPLEVDSWAFFEARLSRLA
ncbi:MAG: hypothetical protein H6710_09115 [Myxococcales bacterium]|nr:hypothetical protein [Myxococcales bacterium]MCB9700773.1 hypothetical protein [Myxococcales bacterium]